MIKKITCIECPRGCQLKVDVEGNRVIHVTGHECPKGEAYAKREIENPLRVLTTTVVCQGLELKMVPVRTSGPIPKEELSEAMQAIRQVTLSSPVKVGAVIIKDLLGLGVNLIATRQCPRA